ncbi:hypothetical protein [Roseateles sp.]|uniref:hypothetical protein n=1 Tax=Roseateles sp. TaxID=1971397 RepID=UPI0032661B08
MPHPTAAALFALSLLATAAMATPPPPEASFEQEICAATHVFVGTASNVRFVTAKGPSACKGEPAVDGGFITLCGRAEVDVKVEKVLYPKNWKAPQTVRYQFGGGYFAVESLKRDLEGQRYLLHAVAIEGEPADVFGPSYPWVLGKSPKDASRVERALKTCKRRK